MYGREAADEFNETLAPKTHEKLDKDRFRRDLGNVEEAYDEILNRIFG